MRVLHVDDDPRRLKRSVSTLEEAGFDALSACSADDGRYMLQARPFDVVVVGDVESDPPFGRVAARMAPDAALVVYADDPTAVEADVDARVGTDEGLDRLVDAVRQAMSSNEETR